MGVADIGPLGDRNLDYVRISSHLFLILFLIIFAIDTFSLSQRASIIPQLFILASFATLLAHYLFSIRNADDIYQLIEKESDEGFEDSLSDEMNERGGEDKLAIDNIGFVPLATVTGWLLLFAIAAFFIGFFISVLVFVFVYVYWKSDRFTSESGKVASAYRIGYAVLGSVVITAGTYVLLIEILRRTLLLRVGVVNIIDILPLI